MGLRATDSGLLMKTLPLCLLLTNNHLLISFWSPLKMTSRSGLTGMWEIQIYNLRTHLFLSWSCSLTVWMFCLYLCSFELRVRISISLGKLTVIPRVRNIDSKPFSFMFALRNYLHVSDIRCAFQISSSSTSILLPSSLRVVVVTIHVWGVLNSQWSTGWGSGDTWLSRQLEGQRKIHRASRRNYLWRRGKYQPLFPLRFLHSHKIVVI